MKKEESRDFDVFFVFGGGKKGSEFIQVESKTKEVFFFFLVWRVLGAFYSPDMLYEVTALVGPPPSNGHRSG